MATSFVHCNGIRNCTVGRDFRYFSKGWRHAGRSQVPRKSKGQRAASIHRAGVGAKLVTRNAVKTDIR